MNSNHRIILLGEYQIFEVLDFRMVAEMNNHSVAQMKMSISKEIPLEDIQLLFMKRKVTIAIKDLTDDKVIPLFCGYIKHMNMKPSIADYIVDCNVISFSYIWEKSETKRTFQNETVSSIFEMVGEQVQNGRVSSYCEKDPKVDLLVQYEENNWKMLKRVSSIANTVLFVDHLDEKPSAWMGIKNTEVRFEQAEFVSSGIHPVFFNEGAEQSGMIRDDFSYVCIEDKENYEIGQKSLYNMTHYYIYKKEVEYHDYECHIKYYLGRNGIISPQQKYSDVLCGISLSGTVLSSDGEMLKVHFDIDEKQDISKAKEIEWTPMSGNFMYCMPKVGTKVTVYFSNNNETSAKAVNCIRDGLDDNYSGFQNAQNRQLNTEHNKAMHLFEKEILLGTEGSKKKIQMDENGISFCSDLGFQMYAADSISINGRTVTAECTQAMALIQTGAPVTSETISKPMATYYSEGNQNYYSQVEVLVNPTAEGEELGPCEDDALEEVNKWELIGEIALKAIAGLVVVAAVTALIVVSGGSAAVIAGAIIGGVVAVGATTISDYQSGNSSPLVTYLTKGFAGAVSGALCGWMCEAMAVNAGIDGLLAYMGKNALAGAVTGGMNELLLCIDPNKEFDLGNLLNAIESGAFAGAIGGFFQYGFAKLFSAVFNNGAAFNSFKNSSKLLTYLQKRFPNVDLSYSNLQNLKELQKAYNLGTSEAILNAMKRNPIKACLIFQELYGSLKWSISGTGVNSVSSTTLIELFSALQNYISNQSDQSGKEKKITSGMYSPYQNCYVN